MLAIELREGLWSDPFYFHLMPLLCVAFWPLLCCARKLLPPPRSHASKRPTWSLLWMADCRRMSVDVASAV
jgi:hypothetical protein